MTGTRSREISTPRSPRATMTPSVESRMLSMLSQASGFSILATMVMGRPPRRSRSPRTSPAVRTKERAIMSTPAVSPKWRSARSFSVSEGMLTCTPGRLMPLWSPMGPPATTPGAVTFQRHQFDGAIGQQNAVAGLGVGGEAGVAGGGALGGAHYGFGGDGEDGAGLEQGVALFEAPEANLGALQIEQNPGVHARLAGGFADLVDARRVIVRRAVRGIKAEDVDTGGEQLAQDVGRIGGRSESGDDLGVGHP